MKAEEELEGDDHDDTQCLPTSGPAYLNSLGKNLLEACRNGYVGQVQRLINYGAPYVEDWLGNSALHFASMNGHVETCQYLLNAGIKRDVRTKVDRTPLHLAAQEGHHDVVELLLKSGADRDAYDGLRMTALHWASEHCHVPVIQMLINYGANLQLPDKFGRTPLLICVSKEHVESCQVICRALYGDSGTEVVLSHNGETESISYIPPGTDKTSEEFLNPPVSAGGSGVVPVSEIDTGLLVHEERTERGNEMLTVAEREETNNGMFAVGMKPNVENSLLSGDARARGENGLLRPGGRVEEMNGDEEEEDMGRWPVCMDDENEVRQAARSVLEQLDRLHGEGEESEVKVDGLPNDGGVSWLLNFLELEGLSTEWLNQDEGMLQGQFFSNGREIRCLIRITDQHLIFKVVLQQRSVKQDLI